MENISAYLSVGNFKIGTRLFAVIAFLSFISSLSLTIVLLQSLLPEVFVRNITQEECETM